MNNLEDRLIAELRRSFDSVPEANGDLAAVKKASRVQAFRSRAGVVLGAAALVLVAVGSVAILRPAFVPEAAAPTTSPPGDTSTIPSPTTTVTSVADAPVFTVTARELELDVDAWTPKTVDVLDTRPLVVSDDELEDIRRAATETLSAIGAEPPYSATLIQRANEGQIVLLTHAAGSCITDLGLQGPWSVHDAAAPCMPTDRPAVWEIGDLRLIVWPDLPETASRVTSSPDCGPAAMCIGESTVVLDGVAVLPTVFEGLTRDKGISIGLVAYDQAGNEIASATVQLPPQQVSARKGVVISPDGVPIAIELPKGFDLSEFAVERGGMIVQTSTRMEYPYRLLDRSDHATSDEQVPAGEVSFVRTVIDGNEHTTIAVGLERGTAFVTLSKGEAAAIDPAVWSDAFIDMVGDGEDTLVVQAGPGFELAGAHPSKIRPASVVNLVGTDGNITLTTGSCFFDDISPQNDLTGEIANHERVGPIVRRASQIVPGEGSIWWCSDDLTVVVSGAELFIEAMLSELDIQW